MKYRNSILSSFVFLSLLSSTSFDASATTSFDDFPDEVIVNILSRFLPPTTHARIYKKTEGKKNPRIYKTKDIAGFITGSLLLNKRMYGIGREILKEHVNKHNLAFLKTPQTFQLIENGITYTKKFDSIFLDGVDLTGIDLSNTLLRGAYLKNVTFGPNLKKIWIEGCYLVGSKLIGGDLTEAFISHSYLNKVDLSNANLTKTNAQENNFEEAIFDNATLDAGKFGKSTFRKASLKGAKAITTPVDFEDTDFEFAQAQGAQLPKANFNNSKLVAADFSGANLDEMTAKNAQMSTINLTKAKINKANFLHVYAINAKFNDVEAAGALFQYAQLKLADFSASTPGGTNLENANFNGARGREASFALANLKGAKITTHTLTTEEYHADHDLKMRAGKKRVHEKVYDEFIGKANQEALTQLAQTNKVQEDKITKKILRIGQENPLEKHGSKKEKKKIKEMKLAQKELEEKKEEFAQLTQAAIHKNDESKKTFLSIGALNLNAEEDDPIKIFSTSEVVVYARFRNATYASATMDGAKLIYGRFEDAIFDDAIMDNTQLTYGFFNRASFKGTSLNGANACRGNFTGATLINVKKEGINTKEAIGFDAK